MHRPLLQPAPPLRAFSPFGVALEGRSWSAGRGYRYGFQAQEQDAELWEGAINYKYRVEDPRLGRFFSVDPLSHKYSFYSPYHFSSNSPIATIESEGLEGYNANDGLWNNTLKSSSAIAITKEEYIRVKNWYATNEGLNNREKLAIQKPEKNYFYIYVPYDDPDHPEAVGQGNVSESNDGQGRGPDVQKQSSEMAGFWYRQNINSPSPQLAAGTTTNTTQDNNTIPALNAGILPIVQGGRGLNRAAMQANGQIPFTTTQTTGRVNFLIQNEPNAVNPVNPNITIGVNRADGTTQVLGVFNQTGSMNFNLNNGDQLYYMSNGGSGTTVTYTETR